MALFENGKPKEFLLLVCNFNMTLEASIMLEKSGYIQYLHTLVRGESVCQFDTLSAYVEIKTPLTVEGIILRFGTYFFPFNVISKKKRVMRCGIRKLRRLKVRRYRDFLLKLTITFLSSLGQN